MRRELKGFWRYCYTGLTFLALFLIVDEIFVIGLFGKPIIENAYLYLLLGLYVSLAFIMYAPTKRASLGKVPWYDVLLSSLPLVICIYFAINAVDIIELGWQFAAPLPAAVSSVILCFLVLEALRRTSGLILVLFCGFFVFYPIFSCFMPGFLEGQSFSFIHTMGFHALSTDSLLGIPMRVVGTLVIGFVLLGTFLIGTGGDKFFLNLASALLGRQRGGPAKIAVVASGFFGSMSGSVVANVATTGAMTIPAMKRTGYPPHYAGAIEACASTGGTLMPPVMGATAFVMASMLGIPYLSVATAALLPSILYFGGLLIQADSFAAREGLRGLTPSEIPSLKQTLKEGWFYIFILILLVYFLYLRLEAQAPFYAIAALVILSMTRKATRLNMKRIFLMLEDMAHLLCNLVVILAACGFIIGSFAITGTGHAFSRELVAAAGGNVVLMLVLGALASFLLGTGMTVTACYIFLAITLAPAIVSLGFDIIGCHLYVLYWGMISFITPPVALGAITGAKLAGADPVKTGFTAMRLGAVIYIIPFIFLYDPALLLHGSPTEIMYGASTAIIGVFLLAGGLGRYVIGMGKLSLPYAILLCISGLFIAFPILGVTGDLIGIALFGGSFMVRRWKKKPLQ